MKSTIVVLLSGSLTQYAEMQPMHEMQITHDYLELLQLVDQLLNQSPTILITV